MNEAGQVYLNYSGQLECIDVESTDASGDLDGAAWDALACN